MLPYTHTLRLGEAAHLNIIESPLAEELHFCDGHDDARLL